MVVCGHLVGFYTWIKPTYPTYSWGYKPPSGVKQQKSWQLRPQEMQQLTLRLNSLELRVLGPTKQVQNSCEIVKRTRDTNNYPSENSNT